MAVDAKISDSFSLTETALPVIPRCLLSKINSLPLSYNRTQYNIASIRLKNCFQFSPSADWLDKEDLIHSSLRPCFKMLLDEDPATVRPTQSGQTRRRKLTRRNSSFKSHWPTSTRSQTRSPSAESMSPSRVFSGLGIRAYEKLRAH